MAFKFWIFLVVTFGAEIFSGTAPDIFKSPAQVEVRERAEMERSSPDCLGICCSKTVHVKASQEEYNLNLEKPTDSIFARGFQYLETSRILDNGQILFTDNTPVAKDVQEIENSFCFDKSQDVVVSLKHSDNQSYSLTRQIGDFAAVKSEFNSKSRRHDFVRYKKLFTENPKFYTDYIEIDEPLTFNSHKNTRALKTATPELLVIFDYANVQTFSANRKEIIEYVGIFMHAVNNRFATSSDPKIVFKLSGIISSTSRDHQPYMENNKIGQNFYDISGIIANFSRWTDEVRHKHFPKHDLIALFSGEELVMYNEKNRSWNKTVGGMAYVASACITNKWGFAGVSVTEDHGGIFSGLLTVTHELAHNMGAPHDGYVTPDDPVCPWSDGYLMSYEGHGKKNKLYFSKCSWNWMKKFLNSNEASCVYKNEAEDNYISSKNIGDRFTMKQLCQKYCRALYAIPDPSKSGDEQCKQLGCLYLSRDKGWIAYNTNIPPGDYVTCGQNKKCVNGDCVRVQSVFG